MERQKNLIAKQSYELDILDFELVPVVANYSSNSNIVTIVPSSRVSTRNSNWWHTNFLFQTCFDKMNVDLWWEISHSFVSSKFCSNSAAMNIWVPTYNVLVTHF